MSKGRILVVDDLPDWRTTLSGVFLDDDYDVQVAGNSEEALSLLKDMQFDLVISDIRLDEPDVDNREGLDLLRHIKELDSTILVIMLTGYADVDMVQHALRPRRDGQSLAYDFVEKSDIEALYEAVENAFEQIIHIKDDKQPRTICELAQVFFELANFEIEAFPDAHHLFWVNSEDIEWQEAGKMLAFCFEEDQQVREKDIEQLASSIQGTDRYAFIVFNERLVDGVARQMWKLKQEEGLTIIPVHSVEIKHTLLEPHDEPSPAYWKLVILKRQWDTLVDPYTSDNFLTAPQWFFGKRRQKIIRETLLDIIKGEQYFIVYGMRRVGKTTLLNQLVLACEPEKYPVAQVLCRPWSNQYTYAEILSEVVQAWVANLEALYPDFVMPLPNLMVERYSQKTAARFKTDILELIKEIRQHTKQPVKFVLILDEVDHIFPDQRSTEETYLQYANFTQILKSVAEAPGRSSLISIVMAMEYPWIHEIDRFPHNKQFQNPLYWRFKRIPIEFLQRDDWDEMVRTIGELAGLEYSSDSLNALYYKTSGHPEITRRLCSCLVELRDDGKISNSISTEYAHLAVNYFLKYSPRYARYLKTTFWENPISTDLDTEQRLMQEMAKKDAISENDLIVELLERYKKFIVAEIEIPASGEEINAEKRKLTEALQRLFDLQIVAYNDQERTYTISVPLYKDWIRQEILAIEVS